MWLINTTTFKLEYILDPEENDTQYAILSHTWEGGEVSFQDFGDLETASQLPGFTKIEHTCQLARSHGLLYAWVDTCCIDKSSSAELSEAINSMFNWYRLASICITFLSDFPDLPELSYNGPEYSRQLDEHYHQKLLSNCRWFGRGWTLQELIAPSNVTFYNSAWRMIGGKTEISDLLARVTGIDASVLLGFEELSSIPVCKRMSWAARRDVRRVEDMAYCLLGIFGVNLPLIYGEGHKAFERLQEEILRTSNDMSILSWSSANIVDPKYRPLLYRKTIKSPRFRGPFAWAPSEFEGTAAFPHETESFLSSPVKMNLMHGSVEITIEDGIPLSVEASSGNTWLRLPGSVSNLGRRIAMTPSGYAFTDDSVEDKEMATLQVAEVPNLRIISHQDAMAFGTRSVLIHCLLRSTIDENSSFPFPITYAWPTHRYDAARCSLTYAWSDLSIAHSSLRLVGIIARQITITVQHRGFKQHRPEILDIIFCFGVLSGSRFWGTTFCKQSKNPISIAVFKIVDSQKNSMKGSATRNAIEPILRALVQYSHQPHTVGIFEERMDFMDIACGRNISQATCIRCFTTQSSDNEPDAIDSIQRFEVKFEREVTGKWVEMRFGDILH